MIIFYMYDRIVYVFVNMIKTYSLRTYMDPNFTFYFVSLCVRFFMLILMSYTTEFGDTLLHGLRVFKMYTKALHSRMKSNPPVIIPAITGVGRVFDVISLRIVCVVGAVVSL